MRRMTERAVFYLALTTIFLLTVSATTHAQAGVSTKTGTLADGATYLIEVPANWNGTLFLYSHGYFDFRPVRYLRPFDALTGE